MNKQLQKAKYLFLDRDGVINRRKVGGYIEKPSEFCFLPGVLDTIPLLNAHFERIFIVTNQQGIGKSLMTEADLQAVHSMMLQAVEARGGHIDAIYHCPHLAADACHCRKPNVGMALQAKSDFPEVDFEQSVLVGDSVSDLQMGQNLSMFSIWLGDLPMPQQASARIGQLSDLKQYLSLPASNGLVHSH